MTDRPCICPNGRAVAEAAKPIGEQPQPSPTNTQPDVEKAVKIAIDYGGIDGAHHKAWCIDQMVRALTGEKYDQIVADAKAGKDGPETYDWDTG
jgi:hypothetical protein